MFYSTTTKVRPRRVTTVATAAATKEEIIVRTRVEISRRFQDGCTGVTVVPTPDLTLICLIDVLDGSWHWRRNFVEVVSFTAATTFLFFFIVVVVVVVVTVPVHDVRQHGDVDTTIRVRKDTERYTPHPSVDGTADRSNVQLRVREVDVLVVFVTVRNAAAAAATTVLCCCRV